MSAMTGGTTWVELTRVTKNADWNRILLDLSDYNGKKIRLRFRLKASAADARRYVGGRRSFRGGRRRQPMMQ